MKKNKPSVDGRPIKKILSIRMFTEAKDPYPLFEDFRVGEKCCSKCERTIQEIRVCDETRTVRVMMENADGSAKREKVSVGFKYSYFAD